MIDDNTRLYPGKIICAVPRGSTKGIIPYITTNLPPRNLGKWVLEELVNPRALRDEAYFAEVGFEMIKRHAHARLYGVPE